MTEGLRISGALRDPEATERAGAALGEALRPGDAALLSGGLGAGKSAFARAAIRRRLALEGRNDETPSPTYTLIQTYETAAGPVRHADLYRLGGPDEVEELGLFDAAESAILLIEWPERLGDTIPERRVEIRLEIDRARSGAPEDAGRRLDARFFGRGWKTAAAALRASLTPPDPPSERGDR